MTCAEIRIELPDGRWIQEVSSAFPDTVFRVLSVISDEDQDMGMGTLEVEVDDTDVEDVVEEVEGKDDLLRFEVLYRGDKVAIGQFEAAAPVLHSTAKKSGTPPDMPLEVVDGEVRMRITAPRDKISDFVERLEEMGFSFGVSYTRSVDRQDTLTEKQRRLVEKAVEMGYYDTPRRCSLTELAEEMGIAKSTCSDTMHRAEENVIKEFVGERG